MMQFKLTSSPGDPPLAPRQRAKVNYAALHDGSQYDSVMNANEADQRTKKSGLRVLNYDDNVDKDSDEEVNSDIDSSVSDDSLGELHSESE